MTKETRLHAKGGGENLGRSDIRKRSAKRSWRVNMLIVETGRKTGKGTPGGCTVTLLVPIKGGHRNLKHRVG